MAEHLTEITGATFHALTVLETAQRDTIESLLTHEQRHRFREELLELDPAETDTDIMQAQQDLGGPHVTAADRYQAVGQGCSGLVRDP